MSKSTNDPSPSESHQAAEPRPNNRRFLRFSTRTLICLLTLCSIPMFLWVRYGDPIREQWIAIEPLLEKGCTIKSEASEIPAFMSGMFPDDQTEKIVEVSFNRRPIKPEDILILKRLPYLKRLYVERTQLSPELVEEIAKLETIERLAVWGNRLNDASCKHLAAMPNLQVLDITKNNELTWRCLEAFQDRESELELRHDFRNMRLGLVDTRQIERISKIKYISAQLISLLDPTDDEIAAALSMAGASRLDLVLDKESSLTNKSWQTIRDSNLEHLRIEFYSRTQPQIIKDVSDCWADQLSAIEIRKDGEDDYPRQMTFHTGKLLDYYTISFGECTPSQNLECDNQLLIEFRRLTPSSIDYSELPEFPNLELLVGHFVDTEPALFEKANGVEHLAVLNCEEADEQTIQRIESMPDLETVYWDHCDPEIELNRSRIWKATAKLKSLRQVCFHSINVEKMEELTDVSQLPNLEAAFFINGNYPQTLRSIGSEKLSTLRRYFQSSTTEPK